MNIKIKKLVDNAVIPTYAKSGDAGMDLTAVSKTFDKDGNIVYGFGIAMEIPDGYVGFIFPRSSVAKKYQQLTNCVGVIDSGYRGEIMVKFKPTLAYLEMAPEDYDIFIPHYDLFDGENPLTYEVGPCNVAIDHQAG